MDSKKSFDPIGSLDQFDTHTANVAVVVATYYKSLVLNGVPHDVAKEITIDFSNQVWGKALFGTNE